MARHTKRHHSSIAGNYTRDDAHNNEQRKEEILMGIQEYLGSDVIYAVHYDQFVGDLCQMKEA